MRTYNGHVTGCVAVSSSHSPFHAQNDFLFSFPIPFVFLFSFFFKSYWLTNNHQRILIIMYSAKGWNSPTRVKWFLPRHGLHPSKISVVLIVLLIILFVHWHHQDVQSCPPATPSPLLRPPDEPSVPKARVAMVTFTTQQQSYTHLSLKNHHR